MRFTLVSIIAFVGLSVGASGAMFALTALAGLSLLDTMAAVIFTLTACAVFTVDAVFEPRLLDRRARV